MNKPETDIQHFIEEQKRIEKRLTLQLEVTRILVESFTRDEAVPKILKAICEGLDFQIGELWLSDSENDLLQLEGNWHKPDVQASEFIKVSEKCKFGRGVSLQGKVWESKKPIWNSRALEDQFFPRAALAVNLNLNTALAFPIYCRHNVMGVMAFYKSNIEEPDNDLLIMVDILGKQIGDFIERKITEPGLQESESLYKNLVEISPDAITYTDLSGKILFCNRQAANLFGFKNLEEIIGQNIYAFIAPEYQSHAIDNEHNTIENRFTRNIEYILLKKDGERFFAEENNSLVLDSHGNPKAFIGVIRDITKRKHDEKEIRTKIFQQETIAKLGQHALAGSNISLLMEDAASVVTDILKVEFCEIMEYERKTNSFLLKGGKGWEINNIGAYRIKAGANSHAGFTMMSNVPVIAENYINEKRFTPSKLLQQHKILSGITVVIHGKEHPYGVLGAHSDKYKLFTKNDSHFLQAIANVLANAIERKKVEEELARSLMIVKQAKAQSEESRKHLAYLAEASRILSSTLNYKQNLRRVAELLTSEFSNLCVIDLIENNILQRVAIESSDKEFKAAAAEHEKHFPVNKDNTNIIFKIINSGRSELFNKIGYPFIFSPGSGSDNIPEFNEIKFNSAMIVPIKYREEVMGTISLISFKPVNIYTNTELSFSEDLARRSASAIENARLYKEANLLNEKLDQRVKERTEELEISNMELGIEVKLRSKTVDELGRRAQKQSAVALLSQRALTETNLNSLFANSTEIIVQTLSIDYCYILKYLSDGKTFILSAGYGWNEIYTDNYKLEPGENTVEIFTLCSKEPVIISDFRNDKRFILSDFLVEHRVRSGVSNLIRSAEFPFGILGAFSKDKRDFLDDDVNFLSSIANVLSAAIERKQIENELKIQAEIINQIHDAVVSTDLEGKITSWNNGAARLLGYKEEEAIGKNISFLYRKDQIDFLQNEVIKPLKEKGSNEVEVEMMKKTGEKFYAHLALSMLKDDAGKCMGMIGYSMDITQLKKAESKFKSILENSPDAVVIVNKEGKITYANTRTENLFGYRNDELLEQTFILLMPERFRNKYSKYDSNYFDDVQPRIIGGDKKLFGLRKNGSEFPIEISVSQIETEEGIFYTSAIRDLSGRVNV